MTNKHLAKYLQKTADLIELTGGNPFRAKAFANGARILQRLPEQAAELLQQGTLGTVQGIGKGLVEDIRTLIETGVLKVQEELVASLPPGLPDVLQIKGLGVKKVRTLWQSLQITSLEALETAARSNALKNLEGFGAKTQASILEQIALIKQYQTQRRYETAWRMAEPVLKALESLPEVQRLSLCGEMRLKMPVVSQITLMLATETPDLVLAVLAKHATPEVGEAFFQGRFADGFPFIVYRSGLASFGTNLWWQTGPEAHTTSFVARYAAPRETSDEAAIYAAAGLAFVEPELRVDGRELDEAAHDTLPNLITQKDLRGTLHNHSTWSDGAHALVDMAEEAYRLGYEYYGACDHSRSLVIANGMSIEKVMAQQAEIQQLNAFYAATERKFRIFSGVESDILADGALDYPDEVLASFDLVVASIHTGFNMTAEAATNRLIKAIEHPATTILGHPTARLLLVREGYPIEHERVIEACAQNQVALELNANPYRLDVDWTWIRYATARGVLISINPDAHSKADLQNDRWGIEVARKGGLTAAQCLNAMPLDVFATWLAARKRKP